MTSPYLDLPLFPLEAVLKAGVKALCARTRRVMPDYPDHASPNEDYRQLAHRLRELAQETRRPYARQELVRLSRIYERRAEHLDRRADSRTCRPRH
jgi:hypothetical protein